jgi:hypothetical protein
MEKETRNYRNSQTKHCLLKRVLTDILKLSSKIRFIKKYISDINYQYILGRIFSVLFKPILLYYLTNNYYNNFGIEIGLCFLITPLSFIFTSFDTHRNYYHAFILRKKYLSGKFFQIYLISITFLTFIAIIFAFIFLFIKNDHNIIFILSVLFYILTEKLIDEFIRFKLFEKDFKTWGRINIQRICLSSLILLFCLFFDLIKNSYIIILIISICNLIVIFRYLLKLKVYIKKTIKGNINFLLITSLKSLKFNISIWISSSLSVSIIYTDRIFAYIINQNILPSITIASTCFSLIQMGIEFFYISNYRREFLEKKMKISSVLSNTKFLLLIFSLIFVSVICYIMIYNYSSQSIRLNFEIILSIILINIFLAINSISYQILYWENKFSHLIKVDVLFWFLLLFIMFIYFVLNLKVESFYILLSINYIFRMFLNFNFTSIKKFKQEAILKN